MHFNVSAIFGHSMYVMINSLERRIKMIKKRGTESTVKDVFLRNIGLSDLAQANAWFKKSIENNYHIDGLQEAADKLLEYKAKPVTIIGDYDVDGITATAILYLAFRQSGFKKVSYRIPKRFSEGYGINMNIIDEVDEGLIITVDNGIAQNDVIKAAKDKGLYVIVTDHHLPNVENGKTVLPEADIVIDPNAIEESADFNGYCGAGIACKLGTLIAGQKYKRTFQAFAALGTVADVMELKEENYVIVRNGLKYLLDSRLITTGLYALISSLGLNRNITATDIGFKIAPCLNAFSRMKDDGAMDAVRLVTFNGDYPKAVSLAEEAIKNNDERKKAKNIALATAERIIKDEGMYSDNPLVLNIPDVNEGLIGIIAGSLSDKYKVPCFVMTEVGDGYCKGSARGAGNYNVKGNLDKVSGLMERYGGHVGAAGFLIKHSNISILRDRLNELNTDFECEDKGDTSLYDLEIKASEIPATIEELKKYAPYGEGNPEIVFKIKDFSTVPVAGKYKNAIGDGSIIKLHSKYADALGFDMAGRMYGYEPHKLLLIGTLSDNYYGDTITHQIMFYDFSPIKTEAKTTSLASKLKKRSESFLKTDV